MSTFDRLLEIRRRQGAGYLVLLDPDRLDKRDLGRSAAVCAENGADAILFGGSFLLSTSFDWMVREVRQAVDVPVIIFPGPDLNQISPAADAILLLSMISGRNPDLLIGIQVRAAPVLKAHGLEAISTGYMLVESGASTTAEYVSNTKPMPRSKPEIAKAHALAVEYLGMQCVYLDAGSGASQMVPEEMTRAVTEYVSLPVIVGGGIRRPADARARVEAGAAFIVTGNVLEGRLEPTLIREFSEAVHIHG